jgi:DGQHR domain-containing protein
MTDINYTDYKITADKDLSITVFSGREGIGQTYSSQLTYQECAQYFDVESLDVPTTLRMQREADNPRVKAIVEYLSDRDNTFFPSVILIVNRLDLVTKHNIGKSIVHEAVIPSHADRLFIDGQGRLSAIKKIVAMGAEHEMLNRSIDVKIIVVDTPTIRDSSKFVTQLFSDLHLGLKKPNSSQSIYFDSEKPVNRIAKNLLSSAENAGVPLANLISITGKVSGGQAYTLANLADFVSIIIGENKKKLNELLNDTDSYNIYLSVMTQYFAALYEFVPAFASISDPGNHQNHKSEISENVLTCAIGLKALAWVGRSFIENALANEQSPIDFTPLQKLTTLPIDDKRNELWQKREIYQVINGKLTIVKASEKRLASVICHNIRLLPSEGLI